MVFLRSNCDDMTSQLMTAKRGLYLRLSVDYFCVSKPTCLSWSGQLNRTERVPVEPSSHRFLCMSQLCGSAISDRCMLSIPKGAKHMNFELELEHRRSSGTRCSQPNAVYIYTCSWSKVWDAALEIGTFGTSYLAHACISSEGVLVAFTVPTIRSCLCLKKQKIMYKVLMPSIKTPI